MMQVPTPVVQALSRIDEGEVFLTVREIQQAIQSALAFDEAEEAEREAWWAEWAAFSFYPQREPRPERPWNTYFQPAWISADSEGAPYFRPDLSKASSRIVDHWATRAAQVVHPVLIARYADLAWDLTKTVTGRRPSVEMVRLAVDAYVAASQMDQAARGETTDNLIRALKLAQSVKDAERTQAVVAAVLDYVSRTAENQKLGTYLFMYDCLLGSPKAPQLRPDQEDSVIARFEACLADFCSSCSTGGKKAYQARQVGTCLAQYYRRASRVDDATRVLAAAGRAFEEQAHGESAIAALHSLARASDLYAEANSPSSRMRVMRRSEELAPQAGGELPHHVFEFKVDPERRERFLDSLRDCDYETAMNRLVHCFILDPESVDREKRELDREFPLQALFQPVLVDERGIRADVPDSRGDPEGQMVFEVSQRLPLIGPWLSWGLEDLFGRGLTKEAAVELLGKSPVFDESRLSLLERGVGAHLEGDYVASIHILTPQLEHSLVQLISLLGGVGTKPHRSGRGYVQAKSLNDALDDERVRIALGENLRMHLVSVLSHPKGLNIRNMVSHGLWGPTEFTKQRSEWLLHALFALGMLRQSKESEI